MVCPVAKKRGWWPTEGVGAVHVARATLSRWAKRLTSRRGCVCTQRHLPKTQMLALQPSMDRLTHELSAQRDRQVRLHSVETDIALDLPPSIQLPDGEEIPYGSSTRLHIRDAEQESEIYQKCVRPPPNRTVFDSECPPAYRWNSAGVLPSEWSSSSSSSSSGGFSASASGSGALLRCHSMSASQSVKRPPDNILGRTVRCLSGRTAAATSSVAPPQPPPPSVVVPQPPQPPPPRRCRRLSAFSESANSLASLPTVHCATQSKIHRPAV